MKLPVPLCQFVARLRCSRYLRDVIKACAIAPLVVTALQAGAATSLSDSPIFATNSVPGNVALALSVEWPTASRAAYPGTTDYSSANTYRGYFDANKCYAYQRYSPETATNLSHFYPTGAATTRTCSGRWSGNFLNWAATQAIDPFRSVMTGGHRVKDTATETILQKAWHSGQGNLYPNKTISTTAVVSGATPFSYTQFNVRIDGAGFRMLFKRGTIDNLNGDSAVPTTTTQYSTETTLVDGTVYELMVRVKVCDSSASAGGVEPNCQQYGSNWKPEGLMQEYSQRLRFSAFGYLNETGNARDGAVMRARMKFVGPQQPRPGQTPTTNPLAEWDATTGVFTTNPDSADATATNTFYSPSPSVSNSGVANYLNKFGQLITGDYKGNDPVSELYYTAQRYYRNLGNVPEWTTLNNLGTTPASTQLDGFPVIRTWDDPIAYHCQKNFILGIGDIYTHADKNIPGATGTSLEPTKPASVSGDTAVDAQAQTNAAFTLQGLSAPDANNYSGRNNSAGMVGLAYWANTNDIRPDVSTQANTTGRQTIQTLWVDVLEQPFVANNQFYLTAKYGGFIPQPRGTATAFANTAAQQNWWSTTGDTVGTQPRPDNYFTAGNPDQMISGLTQAFQRINALSSAFTTSFSTSLPQLAQLDNASYGAQYDPSTWTGELVASSLAFDSAGNPTLTESWRASAMLATQLAGSGWDTARRVATWSGTAGITFRHASLSTAQRTALDTLHRTGDDSADYVNYLRGDRTHEQNSTVSGSSRAYRTRSTLLGDIVGSRARPVGPPALPLSDTANPGYNSFKTTYGSRPTIVYVGANDGMLHAFNGALTGSARGQEVFAYVPSPLFNGPSNPSTAATRDTDALASLGKPSFEHHYMVNATPTVFDVDFTRTWTGSAVGSGTASWRSILIGGLGKGGRSYYAINVTDPATITTETIAAQRVLWEFTAPEMGYTFGEPMVVKTRKYGWTVVFPSGYNTSTGQGYLFFVNPRTGALLETVATGEGTTTNDAGLAHANAYVLDYTDGYADAIYGGDLLGNLWRFDVTATTGSYPSPTKIAVFTDSAGNRQPVTTRPSIELHPRTKKRTVLIGTGRLLDTTDINSTQEQSFYAIEDGNQVRFNRMGQTPAQLPAGIDFPIERADLVQNANLLQGYASTTTSPMGWYVDLGRGSNNVGWRVVTDSTNFFGIIGFAPTLPDIGDPCVPSGSSRIYAADYSTGISRLINDSGVIAYRNETGVITDLRFLSVAGRTRLIGGNDRGEVGQKRADLDSIVPLRRLNWREIPLGN